MKHLFIALLAVVFLNVPAGAAEFERSEVALVSAVQGVGQLDKIEAGLKISLPDGWYTYWRMPGDSGLAPQFDWVGKKNIEEIEVLWPLPKRFETAGLYSFGYGYGGDVYLPMTLSVQEPGKPILADLKLDMMICKEICIPETHEVSLRIPEGTPERSEHVHALSDARDAQPALDDTPRLKLSTAILGKDSVVVTAESRDGFENSDVIIEVKDNFLNTPPEMTIGDDQTRAVFKIAAPDYVEDLAAELLGEKITVTFMNGDKGIQKDFQF
ncbi:MAG: protein-disulfide reductase DsbD domain-containing protein [Pseudomonadota bacterium]